MEVYHFDRWIKPRWSNRKIWLFHRYTLFHNKPTIIIIGFKFVKGKRLKKDKFSEIYAQKVWDTLNNPNIKWEALKKTEWGPTCGWAFRSNRSEYFVDGEGI